MNMINAGVECNIVSVLSFVHFLPQITESLCIQAGGPSLIGVEEISSKHMGSSSKTVRILVVFYHGGLRFQAVNTAALSASTSKRFTVNDAD